MTSYLFNGQWTTDKNERKCRHMSVIPFPVCEYATNHWGEGRQLGNISNYIEGRGLKKWRPTSSMVSDQLTKKKGSTGTCP